MTIRGPYRHRDILVPLYDSWSEQSIIKVTDNGRWMSYWTSRNGKGQISSRAPTQDEVFIVRRSVAPEYRKIDEIENIASKHLNSATNGQLQLDDLRTLLQKRKYDDRLIEGTLRLLVGHGHLIATITKHNPPRIALRLSPKGKSSENRRAFATAFANDLSAKSEQLGRLLDHGPTVGGEREEMLRGLLEKHIPKRYHVATGFVDGSPNQIDILIYDQIDYAPLFREGNLVVVPLAAVRAMIEVKSNLTRRQLSDALQHLEGALTDVQDGPPIFRGVFGYSGATARTLVDAFVKYHNPEPHKIEHIKRWIDDSHSMIDAICVLEKVALTTGFTQVEDEARSHEPMIVEMTSKANRPFHAAIFFDLLMRFLRYPLREKIKQPGLTAEFAVDVNREPPTLIYDNVFRAIVDQSNEFKVELARRERWINGQPWI